MARGSHSRNQQHCRSPSSTAISRFKTLDKINGITQEMNLNELKLNTIDSHHTPVMPIYVHIILCLSVDHFYWSILSDPPSGHSYFPLPINTLTLPTLPQPLSSRFSTHLVTSILAVVHRLGSKHCLYHGNCLFILLSSFGGKLTVAVSLSYCHCYEILLSHKARSPDLDYIY